MNQKQREYAISRVNTLTKAKIEEVCKRFTTPAIRLSYEEKCKLIRKGVVKKLRPQNEIASKHTYLADAFDFSTHEYPEIKDVKSIDPLMREINEEAARIRDQIMLGDAEEGLRLIQAFEGKVY